ncbi:MAG: YkvA family protein [Anaerolineales bacterium]
MAIKRDIIQNQNSGFFQDLITRVKLILRLIGDKRINFFLKLLPIAAAIYVISPIDLLPGAVFPFIGALDDAVVIWLGTTMFVALCPDDIVQEHTNMLNKVVSGTWREAGDDQGTKEIIDAAANDKK